MAEPALAIRGLHFSFNTQSPLIHIDKFEIARGESVCLVAPSGSGKTTFLSLIAGILQPQTGEIKILGQNFSNLSASQRDRFRGDNMGYIFQQFNLLPYLTVYENIQLATSLSAQKSARCKGEIKNIIDELMERLGIESLAAKLPGQLSVGQQQRVACARAVLGDPALILADEPTSSLDEESAEALLMLLLEVAAEKKTSVLLVSHQKSVRSLFHNTVDFLRLNHGH